MSLPAIFLYFTIYIFYIFTLSPLFKFEMPKRQEQIDICSAEFTVEELVWCTEHTQNCQGWQTACLRHQLSYLYPCHCKWTTSSTSVCWHVCVYCCDKATHLLVTWSLFLAFLWSCIATFHQFNSTVLFFLGDPQWCSCHTRPSKC